MTESYESPFASRYASETMLQLFSADHRTRLWRGLWIELARAESAMGLPITQAQVVEMEAHAGDIDWACIRAREKEVRHDVMAHVHAFGQAAPSVAGIIHLGATSCYVTDNADLILYREALRFVREQLRQLIADLADLAGRFRALPMLGYTHFQPAQPVTLGRRAALWMQDFWMDLQEIDFVLEQFCFLGCRGATGTEASLLKLFHGKGAKADTVNRMLANAFGFEACFPVCSQTYPRKLDSLILNALSGIAQSACRMAGDIRLLQHERQIEEPFEEKQIGSSAMAYKRNPVRSERICSLARWLITNAANAPLTAASQWLERTLDDSAGRRLYMPECFLCADAVLRLCRSVIEGLHVNETMIRKALEEAMPFLATENLLMEAVKRGGDRQALHEVIRRCAMESAEQIKNGEPCDLLERLSREEVLPLNQSELSELLRPERYIGRCAEQVDRMLEKVRPAIEGLKRDRVSVQL